MPRMGQISPLGSTIQTGELDNASVTNAKLASGGVQKATASDATEETTTTQSWQDKWTQTLTPADSDNAIIAICATASLQTDAGNAGAWRLKVVAADGTTAYSKTQQANVGSYATATVVMQGMCDDAGQWTEDGAYGGMASNATYVITFQLQSETGETNRLKDKSLEVYYIQGAATNTSSLA